MFCTAAHGVVNCHSEYSSLKMNSLENSFERKSDYRCVEGGDARCGHACGHICHLPNVASAHHGMRVPIPRAHRTKLWRLGAETFPSSSQFLALRGPLSGVLRKRRHQGRQRKPCAQRTCPLALREKYIQAVPALGRALESQAIDSTNCPTVPRNAACQRRIRNHAKAMC